MRPEVLGRGSRYSFGPPFQAFKSTRKASNKASRSKSNLCANQWRPLSSDYSISSVRSVVIPEKQFAKPRKRCRWAYKPVFIASKANASRYPELQAQRTPKSIETLPKPPARLNSNAFLIFSASKTIVRQHVSSVDGESEINPRRHLNPATKSVRPRDGESVGKSSQFLFVLLGEKSQTRETSNGRVGEMFGRNNRCEDSMPHAIAKISDSNWKKRNFSSRISFSIRQNLIWGRILDDRSVLISFYDVFCRRRYLKNVIKSIRTTGL